VKQVNDSNTRKYGAFNATEADYFAVPSDEQQQPVRFVQVGEFQGRRGAAWRQTLSLATSTLSLATSTLRTWLLNMHAVVNESSVDIINNFRPYVSGGNGLPKDLRRAQKLLSQSEKRKYVPPADDLIDTNPNHPNAAAATSAAVLYDIIRKCDVCKVHDARKICSVCEQARYWWGATSCSQEQKLFLISIRHDKTFTVNRNNEDDWKQP
jgi:hypothetical protein